MKVAVVLFAIFGVALAFSSVQPIDWSKITEKNIYVEPKVSLSLGPRIIGGKQATPHSLPYQVALIIDGRGFCGGSLISRNYVLTAAHCTIGARSVLIILGAHNIHTNEPTQIRITSRNLIIHAGYNRRTLVNDISLIKLPSPVTLSNAIRTIALASSKNYTSTVALLSGWGKTSNSGSISSVLMQINLKVLSNSACMKSFGSMIKSTMVCTQGTGPRGGCNGDSGGPLVVGGQQIGIVSFGSRSCTAGMPTVFTRVSEHRRWIAAHSDMRNI